MNHPHEQQFRQFIAELERGIENFRNIARTPERPVRTTLAAAYAEKLEQSRLGLLDSAYRKALHEKCPTHDSDLLQLMEFMEEVQRPDEGLVMYELVVHRNMTFQSARQGIGEASKEVFGKRPSLVGRHVVDALEARLADEDWTWPALTREFCPCPLNPHSQKCTQRLKAQVRRLTAIYERYKSTAKK